VNPPLIGGLRLASTLIRPTVVTFLDRMLRDREHNLRVDEIVVGPGSSAIGRRLGDLDVNAAPGVLLLALAGPDGAWTFKPDEGTLVQQGATLIVMGGPDGSAELRRRYGGQPAVRAAAG
jgi:voltage-gated potassium channel